MAQVPPILQNFDQPDHGILLHKINCNGTWGENLSGYLIDSLQYVKIRNINQRFCRSSGVQFSAQFSRPSFFLYSIKTQWETNVCFWRFVHNGYSLEGTYFMIAQLSQWQQIPNYNWQFQRLLLISKKQWVWREKWKKSNRLQSSFSQLANIRVSRFILELIVSSVWLPKFG